MKSILFLAQKGGSSKTTLAVHITVAAHETGEQAVNRSIFEDTVEEVQERNLRYDSDIMMNDIEDAIRYVRRATCAKRRSGCIECAFLRLGS